MRSHPVAFTDTAKQDVRGRLLDPEARLALVRRILDKLSLFPRTHRPCPSFGPAARYYSDGAFTVVYDVGADMDAQPAPVHVRHLWPARSQEVQALVTTLR